MEISDTIQDAMQDTMQDTTQDTMHVMLIILKSRNEHVNTVTFDMLKKCYDIWFMIYLYCA